MAKRSIIHRVYNIPEAIVSEAERLGLTAIATGGGNDFICNVIGKNEDGSYRAAILAAGGGAGSPDRITEKSDVLLMLNQNWTEQVAMSFKTAREAMAVMAKMFDPYK